MSKQHTPLQKLRTILEGMATLRDMKADEEHPDPIDDALSMIEDGIAALTRAEEINRDLLEALQLAMKCADDHGGNHFGYGEFADLASAAIAKATGEPQK
jgi:hypothetical protein